MASVTLPEELRARVVAGLAAALVSAWRTQQKNEEREQVGKPARAQEQPGSGGPTA